MALVISNGLVDIVNEVAIRNIANNLSDTLPAIKNAPSEILKFLEKKYIFPSAGSIHACIRNTKMKMGTTIFKSLSGYVHLPFVLKKTDTAITSSIARSNKFFAVNTATRNKMFATSFILGSILCNHEFVSL